MVTLRLLGTVTLDGEDGPVTGRTAQRRRIALLALLAMAREQTLSRDKVVGYLWAETEEEKARRLLSESLYVIRKALGEESVLTSGDDLRLNGQVVWSDAQAFLEALDAGRLEEAAELYRGPFLDGFFLRDAPEFERWVDGERDRLQRCFAEALRKLAQEADGGSDSQAAVVWWRGLAELDPYDAQVAVGYMKALDGAGQRATALQHARVHAALLRGEFDAEPDPEVERLAEQLREAPLSSSEAKGPGAPEVSPTPPPAASPPPESSQPSDKGPAESTAPSATREVRRRFLSSRVGWVLGGVGLALVVAALWSSRGEGPGPPTTPPPERTVVAVLPFTTQGEVGRTLQEGGLATLLSINLDGVGGLRSVDPDALWHSLGRPGTQEPVPPVAALRVARRFGASHYIQGRIIGGGGGTVRVAASLVTVGAPSAESLEVVVDGAVDDPISLADSLTVGLLADLQEASGERLSGIAARTSQSIPALNAYLEGEEEFRATRYGRAREAFERAVEEDETFALAHYRHSISALLDLRFAEARLSAKWSVRHSGRLTGRDRRLLEAWNALLEGEAELAERRYLEILRDYPDEVEAHFGLGEVRVYYHPVRGLSPTAARVHFEDVLRLNPSYGQARFHLLELATSERNAAAFDTLFAGVDPESDQALAWETVRAFWLGSRAEQRVIEERIRRADPTVAGLAVGRVAAHLQDYSAAERLAGLLTSNDRDSDTRAAAQLLVAMMRFAQGRWRGGMEALTVARQLDPAWATELAALYTGYPLRLLPSQEALATRETLLGWEADQVGLSTNFVLFAHNGFHSSLRFYLLAMTSLWAGEPEEALRYAGEVERSQRDPAKIPVATAWGRSIRARVAGATGRTEEAIRLMDGVRLVAPLENIAISPFFSRAFDRYAFGQLLMTADRAEEALSWFRSLTEGYEVVLVAPAHLEMARILDGRGESEVAAHHYGRFLELWENPDQEFQPLVEEAEGRLAALTGSPGDGGQVN